MISSLVRCEEMTLKSSGGSLSYKLEQFDAMWAFTWQRGSNENMLLVALWEMKVSSVSGA